MSSQESDGELIARCLAGSNDAWSDLVTRHSARIFSIALKYGLTHDDAVDVLQTVCLQWWQNLDQIRDADRLSGWLTTVTGRAAMRVITARRRERMTQEPFDDEVASRAADPSQAVEDEVLAAERSTDLRRALARLDTRCQRLLTLLYFMPVPPEYETIAQEFGLAEGSIGALRQRCLSRLRRQVEGALPR